MLFHIAPFVCVCRSGSVRRSLCLFCYHFHPSLPPTPNLFLNASPPNQSDIAIMSGAPVLGGFVGFGNLWASWSFILLGEYFEIKEKVHHTYLPVFLSPSPRQPWVLQCPVKVLNGSTAKFGAFNLGLYATE